MTPKKLQKKSRYLRLGTDEAYFQLMSVSGSSILKLLGMSATEATKYRFRAVVLKDKKLGSDAIWVIFIRVSLTPGPSPRGRGETGGISGFLPAPSGRGAGG